VVRAARRPPERAVAAHPIEVPPEQLQLALSAFLARHKSKPERIEAVRRALESREGRIWRRELGQWATWLVPVEELVPEAYRDWRPLVRDAMQFYVSRLSPARLAPKVVEQIELPHGMPSELRLLRLIAKVPGLQKIGQVLARNRHFDRRFQRALSQLENGICDVTIDDIRAIVLDRLGPLVEQYAIKLDSEIYFEASVSAVVRFTWRNPRTGRRERGVFKVLKPHIPSCYAEDMKILQQLAGFLARRYIGDRTRFAGLAETLSEIRVLLEREVDFPREQRTLAAVGRVYGRLAGIRTPRLIEALSTANITALTHENGVKVTKAVRQRRAPRARVAERLAETLVAVPALARQEAALFHGDPHAGNLLYDHRSGEIVILDWALTERLSREQRRDVALLIMMTALRDAAGICRAVESLRLHRPAGDSEEARTVRATVRRFLGELPLFYVPGAMDALELLDEIALEGIRFPASMVIFRKAAFTLDGVVEDVAGTAVRMDSVLKRYALTHWVATGITLWSLLSLRDWAALQWSLLTFGLRLSEQALFRPARCLRFSGL
jgi:ubiquinone biosynthesis protein